MPNERIALVIGNAAYAYATALKTPVNDAMAMAMSLDRLGFRVELVQDCTISAFQEALSGFLDRIAGASVALFYYSGHALQYDGEHYLIPVDARLESVDDLERLAFQVAPRLTAMRSRAAVSLMFLDTCRDDPFWLGQKGLTEGTKRVIVKQIGLRKIPDRELNDALIAFAAEEGNTAADGEAGGLSPFTKALCEHIETPGLEVTKMMQRVKKSVREATKWRQTPWVNDSLTDEFYFNPAGAVPEPEPEQNTGAAINRGRQEPRKAGKDISPTARLPMFGEMARQPDSETAIIDSSPRNMWVSLERSPRLFPLGPSSRVSSTIAFFLIAIAIAITLIGRSSLYWR